VRPSAVTKATGHEFLAPHEKIRHDIRCAGGDLPDNHLLEQRASYGAFVVRELKRGRVWIDRSAKEVLPT
jgi:hypothetical protein